MLRFQDELDIETTTLGGAAANATQAAIAASAAPPGYEDHRICQIGFGLELKSEKQQFIAHEWRIPFEAHVDAVIAGGSLSEFNA